MQSFDALAQLIYFGNYSHSYSLVLIYQYSSISLFNYILRFNRLNLIFFSNSGVKSLLFQEFASVMFPFLSSLTPSITLYISLLLKTLYVDLMNNTANGSHTECIVNKFSECQKDFNVYDMTQYAISCCFQIFSFCSLSSQFYHTYHKVASLFCQLIRIQYSVTAQ